MSFDLNVIKKPKAIIFDWDNTIVFSHKLLLESLHYTLDKLGMEREILNSKEFKENIHLSIRDGFPKIFGDLWKDIRDLYNDYLRDIHLDRVSLMLGAEKTIKFLAKQDVILSVVSNKDGELVRREAEKFGLSQYFHSVIGSLDADEDKPSPVPAYFALKEHFSKRHFGKDIWFVGDSIADIECGYNAKCSPILFQCERNDLDYVHTGKSAKKKNIQYHKVSSHDDLLNLFKKSQ